MHIIIAVPGQSAESNSFGAEVPVSLTDEKSHDDAATEDAQTSDTPSSGSEYLSGMMNANSPQGLVPKFRSWSLLSLGKYSSYSSTSGTHFASVLVVVISIRWFSFNTESRLFRFHSRSHMTT